MKSRQNKNITALPTKAEYQKIKAEKINDWNLVLKNKMDKWTFDEKWYGVIR